MARLIPQSSTTSTVKQRAIPAIMTLAGWHWRQQWLLFLLMNFGMMSLIFLVCLVPALTEVAPTEELHLRLNMARLPLMSIAFQGLALLLFFLHLMAKILVERQADTLASLHNQGASARQILGSLLLQSVGAAVIACIVGPPLAYLTATSLFPGRYGLHTFWHNMIPLFAHVWIYAGGAALVALCIIIATLYDTMRKTVPGMRLTTSRTSEPLHWEYFRIEILMALITLAAYVLSLALFRPQENVTSPQFPLLAPLAPTLLLTGILPLCLRGTALLTQLGILMMQPDYTTTPMLTVLHTIRPSRSLARMTTLLTLATAFTLFTLIFTASQEQRVNDIAAISVGTDFSGTLADTLPPSYLAAIAAPYRRMSGTTSVTAGAITTATGDEPSKTTIQIQAVDATTFARTALWPQQATSISLPQMMQLLIDQRLMAIRYHVVPAIVDDTTAQVLSLHPGMAFTLREHNGQTRAAHYLVLASVPYIPGSNNGGILVDYQSLTDYQAKNGLAVLPINHVWLRTSGDEASLRNVRKIITTWLRLDNLLDRRFLLASLQSDPMILAVQSILLIEAAIALVLALLGNVVAFWISTTPYRVNRALFHALETEPGHVASLLIWEQASAYLMALLPGLLIGLLLAITLVPILLTHLPLRSAASPAATWYTSQQLLSSQVVIPAPLGITLSLILLLIPLAPILLVRMLSRPTLTHTLQITDRYGLEN